MIVVTITATVARKDIDLSTVTFAAAKISGVTLVTASALFLYVRSIIDG